MSIQHVGRVLDARDSRLSGSRKLVLIALANRTDEKGRCWPSQQLLADECGISIRALADHLKGLQEDGFIKRATQHLGKGNGSRTTYTLHLASLKVAPADIAGAEVAHATFDSCSGSTPHVTNHQEPTLLIADAISKRASASPPSTEQPNVQKGKGKVRGTSRKTQLPPNWTPNIATLAFASQRGLTREEINHEADQFRNHALAQGRLAADWHAAFRTWLGNTVKWRAERSTGKAAGQNASGKSRGGGLVAAGLRAVSEARGYGQPVPGDGGMGAGYVIDGDQLRFGGSREG